MKNGLEVDDPRLGRVPLYDDRSRQYQVRRLIEAGVVGDQRPEARRKPQAFYPAHPSLDQDDFGACTWFSLGTGLNASPHRHEPEITNEYALEAYHVTQHQDPWDGCEWGSTCEIQPGPRYGGSAVITALQVAQARGFVGSYWWCGAGSGSAADDVWEAATTHGVLFGIPWYRSMYDTRDGGRLEVDPTSGLDGYHAIYGVCARYGPLPGRGSTKREHLVLQNTWGDWGDDWYGVPGCCFVDMADVEQYLLPREVYGEAAVMLPAPAAELRARSA